MSSTPHGLVWDQTGERFYETGVNQCALYTQNSDGTYNEGVAWNGITSITESPSGAEANAIYADNIKYLNLYSAEELGGTIEAYTYPDEFAECDGTASPKTGMMIGQQTRKGFALVYKTKLGNDSAGDDFAYKLHIIYGCKASPSERAYATINDSPEAIQFSWEFSTTPVNVSGYKPTSIVTLDSSKFTSAAEKAKFAAVENSLYGTNASDYPEFDASSTYAIGDKVSHTVSSNTKYYICTTAITTAAAWSDAKWTEVSASAPVLLMPADIITALT